MYNQNIPMKLEAMRTLTKPLFTYPEVPRESTEIDKEGNKVISKPVELDIFVWRELWKDVKETKRNSINIRQGHNNWY